MKQVVLTTDLEVPAAKLWQEFSQIENYPRYVKFMSHAEVLGPFQVGTTWVDTTNILIFPQRINHEITEVLENKKICFSVELPLKGEMRQSFLLEERGGGTKVTARIDFDLKNPIVSLLLDSFLQRRLEDMLASTLESFKQKVLL